MNFLTIEMVALSLLKVDLSIVVMLLRRGETLISKVSDLVDDSDIWSIILVKEGKEVKH